MFLPFLKKPESRMIYYRYTDTVGMPNVLMMQHRITRPPPPRTAGAGRAGTPTLHAPMPAALAAGASGSRAGGSVPP
eukprot:COSAG02_NODE_3980_length_5959_cov_4.500512_3_plen_77_part_00